MRCSRRPSQFVVTLLVTALALPANPLSDNDYMVLPGPSGLLPSLPDAVVDLRTRAGAEWVAAEWRFREAKISETDFRGPGPDLGPTGKPNKTYDITPRPGLPGFDESQSEVISPESLEQRRTHGKVSFAWYEVHLALPGRVGNFDVKGSTVVFEIVVDDYAEVWVNGKLPYVLGQRGGSVAYGFNAPNRLTVAKDAKPGQEIRIDVFAINGPISTSPDNFVWVRSATLDFYRAERARVARPVRTEVVRLARDIDSIVPPDAQLEKVAGGFPFTEGPVWARDGYLLFSSPDLNTIFRWTPDGQVDVYRPKSGYTDTNIGEYHQPGSNGLTFDRQGRLTICEHGNRRVTRLEKRGNLTVMADRYQGKRLNSPNDLVYRSDGALYFTDPPFGLPRMFDDPHKELPFSGVFLVKGGTVTLVSKDLNGPNGLAFSLDEKYLYVGNWDMSRKVVMRYPVQPDGTLEKGEVFFDMTAAPGEDAIDGMKIDRAGNLYVTGPGGVWILSPEGKHLGTIRGPEQPHNLAWGDGDGKTLYMTALTSVYRMRLQIEGIRP
jgi:gluconolactonase